MTNIKVAIIHGIGVNKPGYSKDLCEGVIKEFNATLRKILNTAYDYTRNIDFQEIVWDDILGENQKQLKGLLQRALQQKKQKTFLAFWAGSGLIPIIIAGFLSMTVFKHPLIFIIAFLIAGYLFYHFGTKLYYQLRTGFASEFVLDIVGYLNEEVKERIQQRIKDDLLKIRADKEPVTFVAHSLGTVIASDFIWDRQKLHDFGNFKLNNFFTMGSPLALFALRYGAQLFNKPIHIDLTFGRWINIMDKDDPIAYPLKELNKEYNEVVLKDIQVNVGPLGIAHVKYWPDSNIHKIIAKKLAIDWLKLNEELDSGRIERLYAEYENLVIR